MNEKQAARQKCLSLDRFFPKSVKSTITTAPLSMKNIDMSNALNKFESLRPTREKKILKQAQDIKSYHMVKLRHPKEN